ncbi:MAG TPA: Crp/Fnr family transcriptional regulator [Thermoanaerobaculia bacterium]|nr:Crp/Fnr family transcriptional regulator [Thermoanaerobaculia bacterium]
MRGRPYGFAVSDHCMACDWKEAGFFCDLPPAMLERFDVLAFTAAYPSGSVLFAEGEEARGVPLLCHGRAKLSMGASDGKTLILREAAAGEILGLSAVMTDRQHDVTAETIEPSQVKFIRKEDFVQFVSHYPEVGARVALQLANECLQSNEHVRALGLAHSAAEKLARLLLDWCSEKGVDTPNGIRVHILMTHHDIAQMIGTSRETVTRLLGHFRDRGILEIHGASLIVHDRKALESLVMV